MIKEEYVVECYYRARKLMPNSHAHPCATPSGYAESFDTFSHRCCVAMKCSIY